MYEKTVHLHPLSHKALACAKGKRKDMKFRNVVWSGTLKKLFVHHLMCHMQNVHKSYLYIHDPTSIPL